MHRKRPITSDQTMSSPVTRLAIAKALGMTGCNTKSLKWNEP